MAFGYLEDAGIDAVLYVDDAGGTQVGLAFANPARILVRSEHYDRARELFQSIGIPLTPPSDSHP